MRTESTWFDSFGWQSAVPNRAKSRFDLEHGSRDLCREYPCSSHPYCVLNTYHTLWRMSVRSVPGIRTHAFITANFGCDEKSPT